MTSIGFIGLGIMGAPMARRLLESGYKLHVHTRTATKAGPLLTQGAVWCDSPAEVAAHSDVIFIMVGDTEDVSQVLFSERGVTAAHRPGQLVIDMSTIAPLATRDFASRLAALGLGMLDAPVSGGEQGAKDGSLTIMVGGSEEDFQRALPLLRTLGKTITHVGASGAGQVAKACNQLLVAQMIGGVAEAMHLAQAAGVDAGRVREALLGGFAASRVLEVHGERMLKDQYEPGFKSRLHAKDMKIVEETARHLGLELPLTLAGMERIFALMERDLGELDSAAVFRLYEKEQ